MVTFKRGVLFYASDANLTIKEAGRRACDSVGKDCVVTSGRDGKHGKNSKHYTDEALDFRIWNLGGEENIMLVVDALKDLLGDDYDVVLEPDHIHAEYDPK